MAVHQEVPIKPKAARPISETRKVRKPLMERKRRERINNCLEQLALLLKEAKLVAQDKPLAKLEKADILELTVRHLRGFRQHSGQVADKTGGQRLVEDSCGQQLVNKSSGLEKMDNNSNDQTTVENNEEEKSNLIKASSQIFSNNKKSEISFDQNSKNAVSELHSQSLPLQTINRRIESNTEIRHNSSKFSSSEKKDENSYIDGFHKCLNEVKQATQKTGEYVGIKQRLMGHLESCLQSLTTKAPPVGANEQCRNVKRELHEKSDTGHLQPKKKKTKLENNPPKIELKDKKGEIEQAIKPIDNNSTLLNTKSSNDNVNSKKVVLSESGGQGLTLVPMRLADGAVAFLLQGDTNLLIKDRSETTASIEPKTNILAITSPTNVKDSTSCNVISPSNVHLNKNKVLIPATPRKIQSASTKSTASQLLSQNGGINKSQQTSQYENKCQNVNLTAPSIKVQGAILKRSDSVDPQRPHYSISVGEDLGSRGYNKLLSTIKTVTLPIGTVANSSPHPSPETKDVTVVRSVSLMQNSIQSSISSILNPVAVVSKSQLAALNDSNSGIISNCDIAANVPPTTNYVHILARPVVSAPRNICSLPKLQNNTTIIHNMTNNNNSQDATSLNSNPTPVYLSSKSIDPKLLCPSVQSFSTSSTTIRPIPVLYTSGSSLLSYQPPTPPAETHKESPHIGVNVSSISPLSMMPPTPPPSASLSYDSWAPQLPIDTQNYPNSAPQLPLSHLIPPSALAPVPHVKPVSSSISSSSNSISDQALSTSSSNISPQTFTPSSPDISPQVSSTLTNVISSHTFSPSTNDIPPQLFTPSPHINSPPFFCSPDQQCSPSSMALLSTSVSLLNAPTYYTRRSEEQVDDEEYIDVENVSREEFDGEAGFGLVGRDAMPNINNSSYRVAGGEGELDDMWRPW